MRRVLLTALVAGGILAPTLSAQDTPSTPAEPPRKQEPSRCRVTVAGEDYKPGGVGWKPGSAADRTARGSDGADTYDWVGDGTRTVTSRGGTTTVTHQTAAFVSKIPPPIPIERDGKRTTMNKDDLTDKKAWT